MEARGAAGTWEVDAVWIAAALVLLAAWLRLVGLGTWWLNPDEGVHAAIAAQPTFAEFAEALSDHINPPAFYLPLSLVARSSLEPAWLRVPSLLFGVLTVVGVFLVARLALGTATGLLSAALLAVAPGEIVLSQIVRPYTLQQALLAFALWALWRFLDRKRRADLALYAAFLGLALLTHYGSALFLAATALWLVGLAATGRVERSCWRPLAVAHLPLFALLGTLYLLQVREALAGPEANAWVQAWLADFLHETPAELWFASVGVNRYFFGARAGAAATILLGLGLVASLRGSGRGFAALALVALGVAAALSLAGLYPFGETRHASWLCVLLVPLVAEGARFALAGRGAWRWLGAVALLGLWLVPTLADRALGMTSVRSSGQLQSEQLAGRDEMLAFGEPLRALRDRGALVLTDRQTYAFLYPFFRDAGRREPVASGLPYREFAWGPSELVVARTWQLRTGRRSPDADDHVVGLWWRARAAHPDHEAEEVWLVEGGWPPLRFHPLERLPANPADLEPAASTRGNRVVGLVHLDPAKLAAALGSHPSRAAKPPSGEPRPASPP